MVSMADAGLLTTVMMLMMMMLASEQASYSWPDNFLTALTKSNVNWDNFRLASTSKSGADVQHLIW